MEQYVADTCSADQIGFAMYCAESSALMACRVSIVFVYPSQCLTLGLRLPNMSKLPCQHIEMSTCKYCFAANLSKMLTAKAVVVSS